MVAEPGAGLAHGDDFRMRGRVAVGDVAVPAFAEDFTVGGHQHRTDRDFVVFVLGALAEREGVLHPALVFDAGIFNPLLRAGRTHYSHSIVAGGLPLMS